MLIFVCLLSAVMALELEQDKFLIFTNQSKDSPIKPHHMDAPLLGRP